MEQPPLGEQELEVWRFIADRAPVTGRAVVEQFAQERGVARTTVLTVIERLRKKGYLTRRRREGVFHYSPRVPAAEVIQGLVRRFVEKTLAGSLSPLVAYLGQSRQLSAEELAELQRLVDALKERKDEEAG
jgi:predicted transcriptional regulator